METKGQNEILFRTYPLNEGILLRHHSQVKAEPLLDLLLTTNKIYMLVGREFHDRWSNRWQISYTVRR